jgi:hypothetical protein
MKRRVRGLNFQEKTKIPLELDDGKNRSNQQKNYCHITVIGFLHKKHVDTKSCHLFIFFLYTTLASTHWKI